VDKKLLRKQLEEDEGIRYSIYLDHLDYPTFGIGHLITKIDPEYGLEIGTEINEDRVAEAFEQDIKIVLSDCERLYPFTFENLPEEVQLIVANMMFNLGYPRLSKFKGMRSGVDEKNWDKAADEMVDSRWYRQVPNRANRLVERMRAVS